MNKSYDGTKVDIFSIGVILFVMVTGAMPYLNEANLSDKIYKYLCAGNFKKFWKKWREFRDPDSYFKSAIEPTKSIIREIFEVGLELAFKFLT